jgi:hypothetical protein
MFINEQGVNQWKQMLTENFHVDDKEKLEWVSQYAAVHEIHESQMGIQGVAGVTQTVPSAAVGTMGNIYATPLNTMGMGNMTVPSQLPTQNMGIMGADFHNQLPGSGDLPVSTLPMALNIALLTIGLELVPVIPTKGPFTVLTYLDFPYAGGKMNVTGNLTSFDGKGEGRENKPIYVKILGELESLAAAAKAAKAAGVGTTVVVAGEDGTTYTGQFKGIGRNDGGILLETISCVKGTTPASITEVFNGEVTIKIGTGEATELVGAKADFVQTSADFIDGFANFVDGGKRPMTRAENETGTGNSVGLRLFNKWVQVGSYEVTGAVTRQQLQDLPLFGVDAVSKIMEAMQNEITQTLNQRILERVFALGVTNAVQQKMFQNLDLNLYMGKSATSKALADFDGIGDFIDNRGIDRKAIFNAVPNVETLTSAENTHTRQRRISSRILAAANVIQTVGRRGRATWVVTNAQVATALQDVAQYVVAPMANNMAQDGSQNLFLAGSLAGLKVYVDPYMPWGDTRVCVGRKGDGNSPGVIFMPYILADTVSITAEGTMAPKMLVNSRYAIVEAGFYPELQYLTFAINNEFGLV